MDETIERKQVYINKNIHKAIKLIAVENGGGITELVETILEKFLTEPSEPNNADTK